MKTGSQILAETLGLSNNVEDDMLMRNASVRIRRLNSELAYQHKFACRIWFHSWTKWSTPITLNGVNIQTKRCTSCNKILERITTYKC